MGYDIILINPRYNKSLAGWLNFMLAVDQPLGLGYIAAHLLEHSKKVGIIDANALNMEAKQVAKEVVKKGTRYVGITASTQMIELAYEITSEIKKLDKEIKVIIGGVHGTYMGREVLDSCKDVDIIVKGEGEEATLDILNGKPLKNIKGIYYRGGETACRKQKNIDNFPFPARDLFPLEKYHPGPLFNIGIKGKRYQSMITARGCPNKCTYCSSSSFWRTFRARSTENILKEIDTLVEKYNLRQLSIKDDTFTAIKKRTVKICKGLIDRNYDITWDCYARVTGLDNETVRLMKKSGMMGIRFGVESGNQNMLNLVKKNITLNQVRRVVKLCKDNDLFTYTSFMIGLPYETRKTVMDTIKFAKELNPHVVLFFITTPFPGTEYSKLAQEKGWLKINKWSDLNMYNTVNIRTDELSYEDIKKYSKLAHKEFYLRSRFIALTLKRIIKHPKELFRYTKLGLAYFI